MRCSGDNNDIAVLFIVCLTTEKNKERAQRSLCALNYYLISKLLYSDLHLRGE